MTKPLKQINTYSWLTYLYRTEFPKHIMVYEQIWIRHLLDVSCYLFILKVSTL